MATIAVLQELDNQRLVEQLNDMHAKLDTADGEVVLDFSAVRRISPAAIHALEALVAKADEKSAKVALRGVNIDVYKVLKLARLGPRFAFVS